MKDYALSCKIEFCTIVFHVHIRINITIKYNWNDTYCQKSSLLQYPVFCPACFDFWNSSSGMELIEIKTIDWDEYYSAALVDAHDGDF
jgi:hypothetical protein